MLALNMGYSQCVADYDFGDEIMGISPNPMAGENLADGIVGVDYSDVLHILLPEMVLDVDSTLPVPEGTLLDSLELISIVMVDFYDESITYLPEEMGLSVACNNNGASGNQCTFMGNTQNCATLEGIPTVPGLFRCEITVKGWIVALGFPFGQEVPFGELMLLIEEEGCTDPAACNYNENASIDDGSCIYECFGCTDMEANNYDEDATTDDGSCCYIFADAVITDALCAGENGMVDFAVGGTDFEVLFNVGDVEGGTDYAYELPAGTYSATIYDQSDNMCSTEVSFTISEPEVLTITASATDASALGLGVGTTEITGGSGDYDVVWVDAEGNSANPDGLEEGEYTVTVVDSNGCEATATVTVLWNSIETINEVEFSLYPNPSAGTVTLNAGNNINNATITIFDGTGRAVQSLENTIINGNVVLDLSSLHAGSYSVAITSNQGRTIKHLQIIK